MPNREIRRAHKKKKGAGDEQVMTITHQGRRYRIDLMEISGSEELDLYEQTRLTIARLGMMMSEGEVPLFGIAGLLWIVRRRRERALTFRAVNDTVQLGDLEAMFVDNEEADEEVVDKKVIDVDAVEETSPE